MCQPITAYVCPSSPGVNIKWKNITYTVNEDSVIVELVLLKEGQTTFDASVTVMTMTATASSEYNYIYIYIYI